MLKLVVVGMVATIAFASEFIHPVNQDLVNEIKEKATTWSPMEVHENPLRHMDKKKMMGLLGTTLQAPSALFQRAEQMNLAVPDSFDSRQQWPNCIHPIRNQQQCGSCWAFAASEALSDRFCIASNGKTNVVFSPEDMVACDRYDMGCNGGWLDKAWTYLATEGIVTDSCMPYTSGSGSVPSCPKSCTGSDEQFKKFKCAAHSVFVATSPATIKQQIIAGGPVETGFMVYQDFMNYKTGIYHHTTGGLLGGHAVKIIGWGVENGTNYWICANSWDTTWGEQGFFRIKQGDSNIDQAVYGCAPELTNATY